MGNSAKSAKKMWRTRRQRYGKPGAPPESIKRMSEGGRIGGPISGGNFKNDPERARRMSQKAWANKPVDKPGRPLDTAKGI